MLLSKYKRKPEAWNKHVVPYYESEAISSSTDTAHPFRLPWLPEPDSGSIPDFLAGFRKGRGTNIKLPTSFGSLKKQESSRKTSTSALLTMPKPLTVWITTNCGKFLKRGEYQTTSPASWEICMQVKKQQLELDMQQQTGSKLAKEYVKAVYCHLAYLTYMQSISCKMPGWMKLMLE